MPSSRFAAPAVLVSCLLMGVMAPVPAAASDVDSAIEALSNPSRDISPRYVLADPNGRSVSHEDFRGQFQLIAFGYTYCPDICPTTLVEMARVLELLGDAGNRVQPVFISVDPERDRGEVLANYTRFFNPRILGLTGSPALVRRAADNFKVRYAKVIEPGAPADRYAVDHSAGMFVIGPDGKFLRKFAYGTPPEELAAQIRAWQAAR